MKETKSRSSLQRQAATDVQREAATTQRAPVGGLSSVSRSVDVLRQADSSVERQAIFRSVGKHGNAHAATVARQFGEIQRQTAPAATAARAGGQAGLASAQVGNAILTEARSWIGTPYSQTNPRVKGPRGRVDCSGLTQASFEAGASVALPRTSGAQKSSGLLQNVTRNQVQAGDLVAFNSMGHVGISAGGNRMVDAPSSGKTVTERNIWTTDVTFRRAKTR